MSMQSFPVAVRLYVTVILLKGVEGAVTVSGSGSTGVPNQQALTLRCSYTVTSGDVVTGFTWRRVEGSSTVDIASGSVTAQTAGFFDSWKGKGVFVGDYTSSLDIQLPASHVTSSYAGTYRCGVTALSGSGYADVTGSVLSVGGAVTVSGSGGTGIPNQQTLTLRCSYTVTSGDVVTGFTWRMVEGSSTVNIASGSVTAQTAGFFDSWKDKGVFVGDYTSSLDIQLPASHVTSSYAGTYRCEVSAFSGSGYADVTASVLTPPSISGLPSSQTVPEFSNLRIDCSTYTTPGNPPTTSYTWTYGGSTVSTGAVLDRRNISRSQRGDYTCTASNSQGSDSDSVSVDVQYGPGTSVTTTPSGSLERLEGSGAFTATCTAVCNPNCTITWRKDNRDLPAGQISISNVSRMDQGTYTCQAQNGIGAPQEKSITLVVYYLDSPRLTFSKSEVMENATVTVDCDVDSNPTVEMIVTNVDNNTVLVQKNTNTLSHTIQRAQCLHNGSYVCSADNRKTGTVHQATKSLSVLCSPRHDFRKQRNSVVAQDKYTTAYLTADIIANPLPNFTWYRHDGGSVSPIRNSTGITVISTGLQSVLQIYITSDDYYGEYDVDVQNSVGQKRMVFTLTSKTPPSAPSSLQLSLVGTTSVSLQWVSAFNGGSNQTFTVKYKSQSQSQWTTGKSDIADPGKGKQVQGTVTGLKPLKAYTFQVFGRNEYGDGEKTIIQGTTLEAQHAAEKCGILTGIGTGIGIGIGICFPFIIILTTVSIVLYRRLQFIAKHGKGGQIAIPMNIPPQQPTGNEDSNLYDGLGDRNEDKQIYTELQNA